MSILHYQKGEDHTIDGLNVNIKKVDPFNFIPEKGWFMSPKEAHGLQKREIKEELKENRYEEVSEASEEKEVLEKPERVRKQFKCKGCGTRRNRFEDTIILNESGLKFCSEECINNYKE